MAKLSSLALSDVLAAFTIAGLPSARDVEGLSEVLLLVRNRIRASPQVDDLGAQRLAIQKCVAPLVQWLEGEPDVIDLDVQQKTDLLWNLYSATVSRTVLADQFNLVVTNEETWDDVMTELFLGGGRPPSPASRCWFLEHYYAWLMVIGVLGLGLDQLVASGRWRFYILVFSSLCFGAGGLCWYFHTPAPHIGRGCEGPSRSMTTLAPRARETLPPLEPLPEPADLSTPLFAPPIPGGGVSGHGEPAKAHPSQILQPGTRVLLNGTGNTLPLQGQQGTVVSCDGDGYDVVLDVGMKVSKLNPQGVTVVPKEAQVPATGQSQQQTLAGGLATVSVYAPYATTGLSEAAKLQAGRLKASLEKAYAVQCTQPAWGLLFWQAVKNESDLYGLHDNIKVVLQAHGYIGPETRGPPRYEELKKQLNEIETVGVVPHGVGGALLQTDSGAVASDPERMAWHLRLPADLQRAGPEIYRNIRAEGVASVRQWVNEQHVGLEARNTSQFQDLFTAATIIDFELSDCKTEASLMGKLAASDTLEIQLRKLGAFIYLRRTKDKTGAARMLGVRAPGTNADIAPKWMLDDANLHSKVEHQRLERGIKQQRGEHSGGGSGKGDGKGKRGRGRGKAKGGSATQG